jgi:hypothetical protein
MEDGFFVWLILRKLKLAYPIIVQDGDKYLIASQTSPPE